MCLAGVGRCMELCVAAAADDDDDDNEGRE